jgi:integrase
MKAVKKLNYLFLRNQTYYFRFNFSTEILGYDIRLSLKTDNVVYALQCIKSLDPMIAELKRLTLVSKSLCQPTLKRQIDLIKENMKQQLTLSNIDTVLAESEKSTSNNMHLMNVLGDVAIADLPDETLQQLADTLMTEDYELMQQKVASYGAQTDSFKAGLSLIAKVAALQTSDKYIKGSNTHDKFGQGVSELVGVLKYAENLEIEDDSALSVSHEHEVKSLLQTLDYEYQTDSNAFKVLMSKFASSRRLKNQLALAIIESDSVKERQLESLFKKPTNNIPVSSINTAPKPTSLLLSTVYKEFLEYKITKEHLTSKMQKDYERYWTVWNALAPDKPILDYEPKDIGIFIDRCFELPKMNKSPYNIMNWDERLSCDVQDEDLVTPKTVQQYYKLLQGVFAYAKKDTIGYIRTSPCTIKRDFKQRRRGIYFDEEVRQFISFACSQKEAWKKWSLLLGIYTGARRSEIYQLRKDNIKLDKDSGRYYLLITDEHESQKLKTDNAKRRIPVHNELIRLGFLEYVVECKERIIEGITSAENITRWFAKVVEQLSIPTTNEVGDMRSFHSFRHTFITKIRTEGKFDLALLQQIVGHEISKAGITDNYTHSSASIKRLAIVIDTFSI